MHPDIIETPKPMPQYSSTFQITSDDPRFLADLIEWLNRYKTRRGCDYLLRVMDSCDTNELL